MRSLDPAFLDRLTLTPEHGSTLRALGEHRGEQELYSQQTPEALETLRTVAMVESTESSNRLEGVIAARQADSAMSCFETPPRQIGPNRRSLGTVTRWPSFTSRLTTCRSVWA